MTDRGPRRRRPGSIRDEAASEPLGLGGAPDPVEPVEDADRAFEDTSLDAGAAAVSAGSSALIDPHGDATDVIRDVPEMSVEDVERRIGGRSRERRRRVAMAVPVTQRVAANRRVVLWRDSATILIFVVVALLAARFLLPSDAGTASATDLATETPVIVGSVPVASGIQFSAAPTINGVVPSGLHVDATPTPIPVITLPPPTPTPVPTPTLKPGQTPAASQKPGTTPKPSVKPTLTPPPSQPPTPPVAVIGTPSCDTSGGMSVTLDASASKAGSAGGPLVYSWDFDEGVGFVSGSAIEDHTFTAGPHNVVVKVTDASGQSDATQPITVTVPC